MSEVRYPSEENVRPISCLHRAHFNTSSLVDDVRHWRGASVLSWGGGPRHGLCYCAVSGIGAIVSGAVPQALEGRGPQLVSVWPVIISTTQYLSWRDNSLGHGCRLILADFIPFTCIKCTLQYAGSTQGLYQGLSAIIITSWYNVVFHHVLRPEQFQVRLLSSILPIL